MSLPIAGFAQAGPIVAIASISAVAPIATLDRIITSSIVLPVGSIIHRQD